MSDLPICKLCKENPIRANIYGELRVLHGIGKCPLNGSHRMTTEQWIELMGEDRDAARYRWLREKERTGECAPDGLFIGVDSDKYPGLWALYEKRADKAIDAAMKEQGNG